MDKDTKVGGNLFTTPDGEPLNFQIPKDDPHYEDYKYKIAKYGGNVIDSEDNDFEVPNVIKLSSRKIANVTTFSTKFVDESIDKNEVLQLDSYSRFSAPRKRKNSDAEHSPPQSLTDKLEAFASAAASAIDSTTAAEAVAAAAAEADIGYYDSQEAKYNNGIRKLQPRKKTSKFNNEKDRFIIEQVRLRPRYRTSHKFYDDLAKADILQGHTGHSVRSRCRVHLLPKIQYVYKTDEEGNLILDEKGEKIQVPLEDVPNTLKNRFSAEEDYLLCTEVIRHVLDKSKSNHKNISRDEYGFFDEKLISVGISFFDSFSREHPNHSSPSWRDRFRKFARAYGVQKYIHDYEESIRNNQIPEAMKNLTRRKFRKKDAPEKFVTPGDDEDDEDELSNISKVAAAAHFEAKGEADALDEEIGELKSSNIDEVLREVDSNRKKDADELDEKKQFKEEEIDPNLESESDLESGENLTVPDSQGQQFKYLPKIVMINEIVTPEFFEFDEKKFSHKVNKIMRKVAASDEEGLINKEFEKIGINANFTSHIMMCSSSVVAPIHKYLKTVYKKFRKANIDITYSKNIYDKLIVENKDGIWNPNYDNLLKQGKTDELGSIQSEKTIQSRIEFLKNNNQW